MALRKANFAINGKVPSLATLIQEEKAPKNALPATSFRETSNAVALDGTAGLKTDA